MTINRSTALSLYRSILRLHAKHLPDNMRNIGDAYVKSEFKLHKNVTNAYQIAQFIDGWNSYLHSMRASITSKEEKIGSNLPKDAELTDDQRNNLLKLKEEAYKL